MLNDGECEQPDVPRTNRFSIARRTIREGLTFGDVQFMDLHLSDGTAGDLRS